MTRRRANPEDVLHRAVADYLRGVKYRDKFVGGALPADAAWTTIPAGGGGKIRGAKLKAQGYHKGWPDLEILYGGRSHYIELKTAGKYPDPAQRQCHMKLREAGARVAICRSVPEVEGVLVGWGIPLRTSAHWPVVGARGRPA